MPNMMQHHLKASANQDCNPGTAEFSIRIKSSQIFSHQLRWNWTFVAIRRTEKKKIVQAALGKGQPFPSNGYKATTAPV